MKRVLQLLITLAICIPSIGFAATYDSQSEGTTDLDSTDTSVNDNVEELDPRLDEINPELVPKPAKPGESVEGRTEFTTPKQNQEIDDRYNQLLEEQESDDHTD